MSCGYYNTSTKDQIQEQIRSVLFVVQKLRRSSKNKFLLIIRQVTLVTEAIPLTIQQKYMIWVLTSPALVLASIDFLLVNSVWVDNFLTQAQADKHLFVSLSCEFDVNVHGTKYNFIFSFQVDHKQNLNLNSISTWWWKSIWWIVFRPASCQNQKIHHNCDWYWMIYPLSSLYCCSSFIEV